MSEPISDNYVIGRLAALCYPPLEDFMENQGMGIEEFGALCIGFIEKGLARVDEWSCLECNADLIKYVLIGKEEPLECPTCGSGAFRFKPASNE